MPPVIAILFGAAFTIATAWALGALLFKGLGLRFHRGEEVVLAFLTGSACLSLVVLGLAMARLAYAGVFLGAGTAALAAAWRWGAFRRSERALPPLPRFWLVLTAVALAAFGAIYFVNAVAPEVSPDGAGYHLGLVSRYLREHRIPKITTNMYANLSQGAEMLFLFAFAFGKHSSAALVHLALTAALVWSMIAYGRRFGLPRAGAAGAVLVFASPVVGVDGASAYVDMAAAAVLFGLFYLLEVWDREQDQRLLVPAGLLAGFAYAVKYTAFAAAPYAAGYVLWRLVRQKRRIVKPLAIVCGCAALLVLPWLVKNWITVGNPFSPFLNRYFPNSAVNIYHEEEYSRLMRQSPVANPWEVPLELAVRGGVLNGLLGPVFLLAPIALLSLREKTGRRLLFAFALFGVAYFANPRTRFLLPALPFLAFAMAYAVSQWRGAAAVLAILHLATSWPNVVSRYSTPWAWRLDSVPWRAALRLEPEESFLRSRLAFHGLVRLVEEKVPPGGKVFTHSTLPEAYTSRELLVGYQSARGNTLRDILWTGGDAGLQPSHRLLFRFPPQGLRKVRVVQKAEDEQQNWSVAELRFYRNFRELPRDSSWRLRAKPNPWEAGMAFDNSPATRWRSWETLRPGMFLEVDFGKRETIDAVQVEASPDQHKARLEVEWQAPDGSWRLLSREARLSSITLSPSIRRACAEELKRYGIGYLLLFDTDFGAPDVAKNAGLWGVTPLGSSDGATLYRID